LRAGASGYVMKREAADKIIEAIRRVAAGQSYLSERATRALAADLQKLNGQRSGSSVPPAESVVEPTHPPRQLSSLQRTLTISIVIPVYNGGATIEQLCDSLVDELGHSFRLQIVLVDDGSTDNSVAVGRELHERHPEVVDCITLSRNFGEHNAVMAGLHCAEGDYCVIMDDDLQNPPAEVRNLIDEITKGYDVVYTRYNAKRHSLFRNLGSRLHNWMATHALGKPPDLYLSSFKIVSRFVVREVIHYTGPDPYLDAIILRITRKIGTVKVRHEPRGNGKSGYTLAKLVSLWGNMFVAFSLYPLRLLGALGIVMALAGFFYGLYTFVALALPSMEDPDGYQRLNAAMWFSRGLTLLAIGIVGEYIGRIYMYLSRDPQFIIRDMVKHRPQK